MEQGFAARQVDVLALMAENFAESREVPCEFLDINELWFCERGKVVAPLAVEVAMFGDVESESEHLAFFLKWTVKEYFCSELQLIYIFLERAEQIP